MGLAGQGSVFAPSLALMNNPLPDANPPELMQKLDVGAAMNGHLRTC